MDTLTDKMDVQPILPIQVSITITIILNIDDYFDGHGDRNVTRIDLKTFIEAKIHRHRRLLINHESLRHFNDSVCYILVEVSHLVHQSEIVHGFGAHLWKDRHL